MTKNTEYRNLGDGMDQLNRVYSDGDFVYREFKQGSESDLRGLIKSGVLEFLNLKGIIPETRLEKSTVLKHERIANLTYPYEWTFDMLKDSALFVLELNALLNERGFELKDCHPWNLSYSKGKWKYLDVGSIVKRGNSPSWKAMVEFNESYKYPLKLMSKGCSVLARGVFLTDYKQLARFEFLSATIDPLSFFNHRLFQSLYYYLDYLPLFYSIPRDKLKIYLPKILSFLVLPLYDHKLLPVPATNIRSVIKTIERIKYPNLASKWGGYQQNIPQNEEIIEEGDFRRFETIAKIINELDGKNLVDLGGNAGLFCKRMLKRTHLLYTVNLDNDPNAINSLYLETKKERQDSLITPACVNFMYPNGNINDIPPKDRFRCDIACCLATTHHLILTQGYSIERILETVGSYANKYVFIEFMPKGLYSKKYGSHMTPDWYTINWFRNNFKLHFSLKGETKLDDIRYLFWGEVRPKR